MKISCSRRCRVEQFFANLNCPNCFSLKAATCPEGEESCKECECRVIVNQEVLQGRWE